MIKDDLVLDGLLTAQAAVVARLEMELVRARNDGDEWAVRCIQRELPVASSPARLVHRAPR